jgi:hypothetical protein
MKSLALESTKRWLAHFRNNARTLLPIPWEVGPDLSDSDKAAITSSIQAFQLGESSEGRHLMCYARQWAERSGNADYLHAIRALIAEETRHASDLGRFMDLNGIDRIERRWTDTVFRRLRNLVGTLEISIGVLVTAEIIAKVYYAALREATQSDVLRAICAQILLDEYKHVEFQTEQLAIIRLHRSVAPLWMTLAIHRILFAGTLIVVGWSHRRALARGGFPLSKFWSECMCEFRIDLAAMNPHKNPHIMPQRGAEEREGFRAAATDATLRNHGTASHTQRRA